MALKTTVYISDVTNLTEARYYAGMEVSMIGFNATPDSDTYSSATQFDAITSWLSGIKTVWQWNLPLTSDFLTLINETPSDFIELNSIPDTDFIYTFAKPIILRTKDIQIIKKISPELKPHIHFLVWEGPLAELPQINGLPVFFQSSPDLNIEELLKHNPNTGIALKGIPELRPGWNDFDQLADLLEALETA